jgi:hypothetical protein
VQEDMGVTVLTESRRQTCGSREAKRTWGAGRSRMAVTRDERRGTRMEYATRERVWWFGPQNHRWRVYGFGPQNLGGGSEEERTARGGIGDRLMKMTPSWTITPLG